MSEPDPDDAEHLAMLARANQAFCEMIPHNKAIGMEVLRFEPGIVEARLPWNEQLVGNPDLRILHGGAITTLLDATAGASVFSRLMSPIPVATLDLRIDYLRPAEPDRAVIAHAHCYKLTRNVAFVRASAYHDKDGDPIAMASGTFMISSPGAAVGDTNYVWKGPSQ